MRLSNAYDVEYGFQPIVVFDGEGRPVAALLRPARQPTGRQLRGLLRRHVEALERSTSVRQVAIDGPDKRRRHKEFHDGAAS